MVTRMQFEELNLELIAAQKAVVERDRILDLMESIDDQLAKKKQDLFSLEIKKQNEKLDVEELTEDWSVASIILSLFGKREAILAKEAQAFVEAKMAVQQCRSGIASLENFLRELEIMLVELADCEEQVAALHARKMELLVKANLQESEKIKAINVKLPRVMAQLKEVDEAVETGQVASAALSDLLARYHPANLFIAEPVYELNGLSYPAFEYIQMMLDRFQLELTDISRQFWPAPKLKRSRPTEDSPAQIKQLFSQKEDLESIRRWHYQQLSRIYGRVQSRLAQIQKIQESLTEEAKTLESERVTLVNKMWQAENF